MMAILSASSSRRDRSASDEEDSDIQLVPEAQHLSEHLPLHHDVERRGGLVHDNDLRIERHSHGQHHPLTHAARELVGVLHSLVVADVDEVEKLISALPGGGPPHFRNVQACL